MGPIWTEMGVSYPKAMGLALIGRSLDPDDPQARDLFTKGFHSLTVKDLETHIPLQSSNNFDEDE